MSTAKWVTHVRHPDGTTEPLLAWASNSRRWLEWAANGANRKAQDPIAHPAAAGFFWWVAPAPYEMPVTAYRTAPDFPYTP